MSAGNKNAAGVDEALRNAEKALQAGRTEAALAECENVVAKNPQSAHAYYLLGVIQARRGATAEAQKSLLRATKLEPSSIASHMNLGRIYLKIGGLDPGGTRVSACHAPRRPVRTRIVCACLGSAERKQVFGSACITARSGAP